MTLRDLTSEEEIILDLIIKQREQSGRDDNCFIYSVSEGQKQLTLNGRAKQYGIDPQHQRETIQKLTDDGIIDADWIIASKSSGSDIVFARHDREYMWEKYGVSLLLSDRKSYEDAFFIKISFSQIKEINDKCRIKYPCTLSYDDAKCNFVVTCNDTGERYIVSNSKLKSGFPPSEVLRIALQSDDKYAIKDDLVDKYGITQIKNKSIATQVFDKNSVVRNELSPFVRLKSDSIRVYPTVKLSLFQLECIKEICV